MGLTASFRRSLPIHSGLLHVDESLCEFQHAFMGRQPRRVVRFGADRHFFLAGLGQLDAWNEAAIQERAGRLADQALGVWPAPRLDAAVLATYQPTKAQATGGYTIDDHPHLFTPGLREVFEAFRKEVLALDPCVSEAFMKLYVAYKAETNFVDVVPQAQRLRLSINMTFAEINDPKGLCKDVTDLGRWGNGDVEVGLKSLDELPYIMGLVRQCYERQMGDGGQA
jgi:predicted transport protein